MRGVLRRVLGLGALAVAASLVVVPLAAAESDPYDVDVAITIPERTDPPPQADQPFEVDDAVLGWAINPEAGSGAFFGGCNFLVAGEVGNAGSSHVWTDDRFYRATAGNVTIEKPTSADGSSWTTATWGSRCTDQKRNEDRQVTTAATDYGTGNRVAITGGTGSIDPASGDAAIAWKGSFSVVHYGGLTYWWVTDPVLTVSDGVGVLTATAGGFGADREDLSQWKALEKRVITLATLPNVGVSNATGFRTNPAYLGVRTPTGVAQSGDEFFGAFPADFVRFQEDTGQAGYWYSTGGMRDFAKVPEPVYVSYSAAERIDDVIEEPPPRGGGTSTITPAPNPTSSTAPGAQTTAGNSGSSGSASTSTRTSAPAQAVRPPAAASQASAVPVAGDAGPGGDVPQATTPDMLTAASRLIPEAVTDLMQDHRARIVVGASLCLVLGSFCFVGFRRGWLSLPWM